MFSYPRLSIDQQQVDIEQLREIPLEELAANAATADQRSAPIAVGHPVASEAHIRSIAEAVRTIAREHGYPGRGQDLSTFDRGVGRALADQLAISDHDASSEEVWGFLTIVVMPDVAAWRFPNRPDERLLGVPRNTFRRVWVRERVLGAVNHDDFCDAPPLGEDELVGIFERTYLSRSHELARAMAKCVREHGGAYGVPRTEVMRALTKRVRRDLPVVCADALSSVQLEALVLDRLVEAVGELGSSQ